MARILGRLPDTLQLWIIIEPIQNTQHRLPQRVPRLQTLDSTVLPDLKGEVEQRYDYTDAPDELPDRTKVLEGHAAPRAAQRIGVQPLAGHSCWPLDTYVTPQVTTVDIAYG